MKRCAAEFVGTFALLFAGTGAIIINQVSSGAITHVGISLTFGLVVLAMIYTVGDISGAHLNPAVSFGFFAAGRFPMRELIPYMLSQCAGAFAASGLLRLLFLNSATLGETVPAGPAMQSNPIKLECTTLEVSFSQIQMNL
jgi:aquaporin NIP